MSDPLHSSASASAANGGRSAPQSSSSDNQATLASTLLALGVDAGDVERLRHALQQDLDTGKVGPGSNTESWLAGLKICAAHGLNDLSAHTVEHQIRPLVVQSRPRLP